MYEFWLLSPKAPALDLVGPKNLHPSRNRILIQMGGRKGIEQDNVHKYQKTLLG